MIKYYVLIPKSKDEISLERLVENMNIIVEKHKEYTKGIRKAKVAFDNFCKVMGKYAIKDLRLKE